MTKDELIAALEKATGPSRELDREIGLAVGCLHLDRHGKLYRIDADGDHVYGGQSDDVLIRRYTASIDAALTLVPEGFAWQARRSNANDGEIYCNAQLWRFGSARDEDRQTYWESHNYAALALCIAALRATPPAEKG